MSTFARVLQILLMVAGFAVISFAAFVWDFETNTEWGCVSTVQEGSTTSTMKCAQRDGYHGVELLGMLGVALEVAAVAVAVGARRVEQPRPQPAAAAQGQWTGQAPGWNTPGGPIGQDTPRAP